MRFPNRLQIACKVAHAHGLSAILDETLIVLYVLIHPKLFHHGDELLLTTQIHHGDKDGRVLGAIPMTWRVRLACTI